MGGNINYLAITNGTTSAEKKLFPLEGVYLKRHGVVFTLTLPPPPVTPIPGTSKRGLKPLSEWEQVRKQIRGEKVVSPSPAGAGKNPTIGDVILKVLAENGRNFSQLSDQEKLTVVVVFRPEETATTPANKTTIVVKEADVYHPHGSIEFGPGQDSVLLGDQHLRLGRPKVAIKAYLQAVVKLKNPKDSPEAFELARKLAQAYLADGQLSQAKQLIDRLTAKKPALPPKAGPSFLPTRLIISASKSLLDEVGSGTLTLEEFRRQVVIEEIPPSSGVKGEKVP